MGRQILFIDDSAMLRRIAASVLGAQPARYEVVGATRASEGFARACGGEVAVILVDERIAGAEGADLCGLLRNEPRTSAIPVVLMTVRPADASKLSSRPENVVEILRKPFAPEQLVSVVDTIVALGRNHADFDAMRRALHPALDGEASGVQTDRPPSPERATLATPSFPTGETSIRSALQAVASDGRTGVLRFHPTDGIATEVFFDSGSLLLVTTHDGAAYSRRAAEFLPAKVSPATLQDAAAEQSRTGVPFLLNLGARGLVSKAAGVELLRRFGQRQFARLWTVPACSLHITFEPLESLPGYTLRVEPSPETVDEWLLDGLRLLTGEDVAAEARHQGMVGTPCLLRRAEAMLKVLTLTGAERTFVQQVSGRRDLPAIARNLGVTTEEAFLLVHRFRCLELLEYRPAPLPFVVTPRTSMRRVLPLLR